jgi:hypothetical protein
MRSRINPIPRQAPSSSLLTEPPSLGRQWDMQYYVYQDLGGTFTLVAIDMLKRALRFRGGSQQRKHYDSHSE